MHMTRDNVPGTENASSGVVITLSIVSSKEGLESLGHTINFIDNFMLFTKG